MDYAAPRVNLQVPARGESQIDFSEPNSLCGEKADRQEDTIQPSPSGRNL